MLDTLAATLRVVARRLRDLRAAVGVVLLAGVGVAAAGIVAFAWVAVHVRTGATQGLDEAVLRWLGQHRGAPWLESVMLDVTLLGTGTVVVTIAGVAALFLSLTRHRPSATLLVAATVGALLLNDVLKASFDRPRPQVFTWGTRVVTTSFPSGHAMSAAAVYATVAYLAARLQRRRRSRMITHAVAGALIVAIGFTRLYLGVHYPSDVAAGIVVGLAWAGFCMATLEAVQLFARRPRHRGGRRNDRRAESVAEAALDGAALDGAALDDPAA